MSVIFCTCVVLFKFNHPTPAQTWAETHQSTTFRATGLKMRHVKTHQDSVMIAWNLVRNQMSCQEQSPCSLMVTWPQWLILIVVRGREILRSCWPRQIVCLICTFATQVTYLIITHALHITKALVKLKSIRQETTYPV